MIWLFAAPVHKLQKLDADLASSTSRGIADSSAKGLKTHINKYVDFCQEYDLYLFSPEVLQFRRYLQHLTKTHNSPDSMRNYISGAKSLYLIMGHQPPEISDYLYRLTLRGITRDKGHTPKQAQPVTPQMLVELYHWVDLQEPVQLVSWTATLVGFYMFFA